jgi:putative Mn2+ efflux pump MntP
VSRNSKNGDLAQIVIQIVNERKPQTVRQLIALVKERLPIPEEKILNAILDLQNQGKIELKNSPLPPSTKLQAYIKSRNALWYWTTIATATITAVIVFTVPENIIPLSYFRIVLGTIFILWLPGYAFIRALFPQHEPTKTNAKNLDTIERIALSLGMSLALVPIVGLLLNYTPWGIRLTPIVLSLLSLTLIFATVAVVREHKSKIEKNDHTI